LSQKEKNRKNRLGGGRGGIGEIDRMSLAAPSRVMGLMDMITRLEGYQLFLSYLETEFSSENLLFWDEVEKLKICASGDSKEVLLQTISSIFSKFCAENALLQVNLSHRIRETLQHTIFSETLSSLPIENLHHVFNEAQQNIYDLMNNDSFPRFQLTLEYNTYQGRGTLELSEQKSEMERDSKTTGSVSQFEGYHNV